MKKVLVVSSSLRKGSHSAALAAEFARGAQEAGNEVVTYSLVNKKLHFCIGCRKCQQTFRCIYKDDADEIVEAMREADVVVFATPVYYYGVSGQLKVLFDRTFAIFRTNYKFTDIYLLASAADEAPETMDLPISNVQAWVDCHPKASLKGVVSALGMSSSRELNDHPARQEAYQMGNAV